MSLVRSGLARATQNVRTRVCFSVPERICMGAPPLSVPAVPLGPLLSVCASSRA